MNLVNPYRFGEEADAFSPLDYSILSWLDASDDSTLFDAQTGGATPANGAATNRIEDKSGNDYHYSRSSGGPTRQAAAQNGLDVLRFTGADMRLTSPSFSSTGDCTIIAVIKADAWHPSWYKGVFSHGYGIDPKNSGTTMSLAGSTYLEWSSGDLVVIGDGYLSYRNPRIVAPNSSGSDWRIISATLSASGSFVKINGADVVESVATAGTRSTWTRASVLGSSNLGSEHWDGDIGEVMYFGEGLSSSVVASAESSLAAKWGISI